MESFDVEKLFNPNMLKKLRSCRVVDELLRNTDVIANILFSDSVHDSTQQERDVKHPC